jgi:hypothetical protein
LDKQKGIDEGKEGRKEGRKQEIGSYKAFIMTQTVFRYFY